LWWPVVRVVDLIVAAVAVREVSAQVQGYRLPQELITPLPSAVAVQAQQAQPEDQPEVIVYLARLHLMEVAVVGRMISPQQPCEMARMAVLVAVETAQETQ
jgi:hypothetical protein